MKVYKLHHVGYIGIIAFDFRYVLHSNIGKEIGIKTSLLILAKAFAIMFVTCKHFVFPFFKHSSQAILFIRNTNNSIYIFTVVKIMGP